jgi:hypothetical protein
MLADALAPSGDARLAVLGQGAPFGQDGVGAVPDYRDACGSRDELSPALGLFIVRGISLGFSHSPVAIFGPDTCLSP